MSATLVSAFDSDGVEEVQPIPCVLGSGYGVLVLLFDSTLSALRYWRSETRSYYCETFPTLIDLARCLLSSSVLSQRFVERIRSVGARFPCEISRVIE